MFKKLFDLKDEIEEKTVLVFSFDCNVDSDNEILFSYTVVKGWNTMFDNKHLFNACDRETNTSSLEKLLVEIKERCLKDAT